MGIYPTCSTPKHCPIARTCSLWTPGIRTAVWNPRQGIWGGPTTVRPKQAYVLMGTYDLRASLVLTDSGGRPRSHGNVGLIALGGYPPTPLPPRKWTAPRSLLRIHGAGRGPPRIAVSMITRFGKGSGHGFGRSRNRCYRQVRKLCWIALGRLWALDAGNVGLLQRSYCRLT